MTFSLGLESKRPCNQQQTGENLDIRIVNAQRWVQHLLRPPMNDNDGVDVQSTSLSHVKYIVRDAHDIFELFFDMCMRTRASRPCMAL